MIIRAYNPSLEALEGTTLSQYVAAGSTSLTVQGNQGFTNGDRILVGDMGVDNAEIVSVNAPVTAGSSLTTTATVFPHNADEPVIGLRYDQVKFYRSTTGVDGTYSLLATVNLDVDNEELETRYNDSSGLSSYYYKISYYNSVSTVESSLSDPVQGTGYSRNSVGALIDEVAREIGDENFRLASREQYITWMNEVNDDMLTRLRRPYPFLRTTTTLSTVAGQKYVNLPADFWKFDRFEYTWTIGSVGRQQDIYPVPYEVFRSIDYDPNATGNDDLMKIAIDDVNERILLWPKPLTSQSNAITLWYYRTFNEINSEGDVFETPTPIVYKKYLMGQLYLIKGAKDAAFLTLSDRYLTEYNGQINKLQRIINKDVGSPRSLRGETRRQAWDRGYF